MKRFIGHLTVALIAFLLGIIAAHLSSYIQPLGSETKAITVEAPAMSPPELSNAKGAPRNLNPKESEIVAEAEHFVCWNGYTHQGCGGMGRIYFESGENHDDLNKIWEQRRETLEGKAYGIILKKKGESTFWTVVFRYAERADRDREKFGRAWTVEEDRFRKYFIKFSHDFPLAKVEKKL
ncbi:MAG: hypothetical protein H0T45_09830 [Pyrinomonadaceae bacterium]|nr:hypothetical protein [Pyrinomonadaceae bacterium]MDQ3133734.1 hypothetical protein [Acidobacteriota bacterium]